jgi:hypothetical protein
MLGHGHLVHSRECNLNSVLRIGLLSLRAIDIWAWIIKNIIILRGAVLCFVGCLAKSLVYMHEMSVALPPSCDSQNVPRHCLLSSGRTKSSLVVPGWDALLSRLALWASIVCSVSWLYHGPGLSSKWGHSECFLFYFFFWITCLWIYYF